ncbi:MAG: helix-turn-helix transcriptional regulator [Clostridiales bacterium]|nr:helix-turn-helix transcriptional regulator [Clostridiales bacterium]
MNRIRELREDRDLRQIDVALATEIDQKTLSNYETGKTNPDSYAIIRLADFFGVTCDYLLGVSERNIYNASDILNELDEIKNRIDGIKKFLNKG